MKVTSLLQEKRKLSGLKLSQISHKSGISRATAEKAEKDIPISFISAQRIVKSFNELSGNSYTVTELKIAITDEFTSTC